MDRRSLVPARLRLVSPVGRLTLAAAAGGAAGAGARAWLTGIADGHDETTLWVTLAINVVGCALLALIPAAGFVRRSHAWSVFLGTGVLGGFTTMSTAVALPIAALSPALALGYVVLTLVAALGAVWAVNSLVPAAGANARLVEDDA